MTFDYDEVVVAAPSVDRTEELRQSTDPRDQALFHAICSLERIAGADSPEGNSAPVDALRNLARIRKLLG